MMECLDYLFWSYYCFCKRHPKMYFGDNVWQSIIIILVTLVLQAGVYIGFISVFITPIFQGASKEEQKLIWLVLFAPIILFLNHRYNHNKKITAGNFKLFRMKWGEDPRVNKKKRILVLCYTIYSIPGMFVTAIVFGVLRSLGIT